MTTELHWRWRRFRRKHQQSVWVAEILIIANAFALVLYAGYRAGWIQ